MTTLERRRHPRFSLRGASARTVNVEAAVLDVSRSGMQIESGSGLPVGRRLRFAVRDPFHRAEVEGRVQWSRLHSLGDGIASFRSGVQFARLLTPQPRGVWSQLQAQDDEPALDAARAAAPRQPMLAILSPEDGSRIHGRSVLVLGRLRDPAVASLIEVNGVPARVEGLRFEATVPLAEGANRLSAALATSGASQCSSRPIRVFAVAVEAAPRPAAPRRRP